MRFDIRNRTVFTYTGQVVESQNELRACPINDDCQRLLSSVKDGKRQAMLTCMAEGCAIDSCTWSLR